MYRHILIPTDGSELAQRGVAHGLALAKSVGAKVTAIYVVEPLLAVTGDFASVLDRTENAAKEAGVFCETIQKENVQPDPSHRRSSRGQRLRSHCYVMARAQRTFHVSNRQCDKQGSDLRDNPRTRLSVNVQHDAG
jgi:hypothetical protein